MAQDRCIDVDRRHCIHTRNGHFSDSTCTKASDLGPMLDTFFSASPLPPLVIHFHGGLVSFETGKESANRLIPFYEKAGAYPICFIWESGPLEAVANNLGDIGRDPAFRELVRKVVQFSLGQLGGASLGKGVGVREVDAGSVAAELDAWFDGSSTAVPFEDASLPEERTLGKGAGFDEADLWSTIENDVEFDDRLLAGLGEGDVALMSPEGRAAVLEPGEEGAKGIVATARVALAIFDLVKRVLVRFFERRDHGLYTTVVEEIYRTFYVGMVGQAFLWDQMKKDTADAFDGTTGPGKQPGGGTLFLKELDSRIRGGAPVPRIVLVGHSAGSIYICNFLEAVDRLNLPEQVVFDIVLLAPAATFHTFRSAMEKHAGRVSTERIRLFGMKDDVESADAMAAGLLPDQLARIVYPRSLPYFIAGLLEGTECDEPILGMQRYWNDRTVFGPPDFPDVSWVRDSFADQTVWSKVDGGAGRRSNSATHGGFGEEPMTLESVAHILQNGFS